MHRQRRPNIRFSSDPAAPGEAAGFVYRGRTMASCSDKTCLQFAVGGLVLPPEQQWIRISEVLRGRAVRQLCQILTGGSIASYSGLAEEQRGRLSLISGKDGGGKPLAGHAHAYFLVWPDENQYPTRLIVWCRTALGKEEIEALGGAAERPISGGGKDRWTIHLVPLPLEMPLPRSFCSESRVWDSVTQFVPPAVRHRFRPGGRLRRGETTEETARRLVLAAGMPAPASVDVRPEQSGTWARLHRTRSTQLRNPKARTPLLSPGFRLRLEFERPVAGPIMIGDSCHFGLGLFAASGSS
jgi:CRISPR-associated protein Csb2